jgi:hypothetical protein
MEHLPDLLTPMGGGGAAGAIAYAVVRWLELRAGLPQIQSELERMRVSHAACEQRIADGDRECAARVARLEERIDTLLNRLTA